MHELLEYSIVIIVKYSVNDIYPINLSVCEIAKIWKISERSIRNYCALGRIPNAFITGKTWNIPANVEKQCERIKQNINPSHCWNI